LIALGQLLKSEARDKQLAAEKLTKAGGAEILPDFARFSHEGDVDALFNGVGVVDCFFSRTNLVDRSKCQPSCRWHTQENVGCPVRLAMHSAAR
jgi:hypothetical protein